MRGVSVPANAPDWAHQLARDVSLIAADRSLIRVSLTRLPPATPAGQVIFVTDATGGGVPAYSDGTEWLRFSDDTAVS